MLNKDKPTEFNPKHRIIGAVILVSVAVIVLPMIFSKEDAPTDDPLAAEAGAGPETRTVVVPIEPIAPSPAQGPVPNVAPAPVQPEATASTPIAPPATTAPTAETATPLIAPPEPVMVDLRPATETAEKPVTTKSTKSKKLTGYYVQVGTFSHGDNARQLGDKLKKKGYRVQLETATVNRARVIRVRVGPYAQTAQAKSAQEQIRRAVGIKGVIGHY